MPSVSDSRMNSWRLSSQFLPAGGEELDGRRTIRRRFKFDLAREGVQVLDERGHDLLEARVRAVRQAVDDGLRSMSSVLSSCAIDLSPRACG